MVIVTCITKKVELFFLRIIMGDSLLVRFAIGTLLTLCALESCTNRKILPTLLISLWTFWKVRYRGIFWKGKVECLPFVEHALQVMLFNVYRLWQVRSLGHWKHSQSLWFVVELSYPSGFQVTEEKKGGCVV
ncbi:unnamed protein product [Ilex paraguariensis]|uniref:Transmembrane protein n=1 Tax=Ilex paraguariensis TaxID=185542 RepID=A0ABC8R928_9AQUA